MAYIPQIESLTKEELLKYLCISRSSYFRLKQNPSFPKPIVKDNIEYWDKKEIDDFLDIEANADLKLFTLSEALKILHICRATYYNLRAKGLFPAPFTVTGSRRTQRWRKSDITAKIIILRIQKCSRFYCINAFLNNAAFTTPFGSCTSRITNQIIMPRAATYKPK